MAKKPMDPLSIMNLLGKAAANKAQPMPDDEEDSANSITPKAKKPPQGVKSPKQVAAIKMAEKNGPQRPVQAPPKTM
jgi:hypothetical protein